MANVSSSYSTSYNLQRLIQTLKNDLDAKQAEIGTGRKSGLAEKLGPELRRCISLHSLSDNLKSYTENNRIIQARLDITKTSLSTLVDNAEEFKSSLILAHNDARGQNLVVGQASTFLNLLISTMNNSFDNVYIFSGEKTNVRPVNDFYNTPASSAKAAIDEAFLANSPDGFGFSQSSANVSTIIPEQLNNFINGPLTSLFSENQWSMSWSKASTRPLQNIISPVQKIETSVTANDPALRKIAMAYVMMCNLGAENMNANTFKTLAQQATMILDEGIKLINTTRSRVGVMQQAVDKANLAMEKQSIILDIQISKLEAVDQTETAAKINSILNQLESSYTLTSRISRLSLVRYL